MNDRADGLTQECRDRCGLEIDDVVKQTSIPRRTLYNWWNTKRRVLDLVLSGLLYENQLSEKK